MYLIDSSQKAKLYSKNVRIENDTMVKIEKGLFM